MKIQDIPTLRLHNQQISNHACTTPADVVSWLGAVQSQDYLGGLWAVGLRLPGSTQSDILKAIESGSIVRTWPMRGTLHFVAARDARWMLELLSPRVLGAYGYRMRYHGITLDTYKKATRLIRAALNGGNRLTRAALYQILVRGGVPSDKGLGLHILGRLALERLICFGPREGKQHTFVLFDEWIPRGKEFTREQAMRELTIRYFSSHGPAQVKDFGWWSGLTVRDIRQGIALAGTALQEEVIEGSTYYFGADTVLKKQSEPTTYLLPPFDEYVVSYKDRSAVLETVHAQHVNPGANGMLSAVVVINGQLVGTWKRTLKKDSVVVTPTPFVSFTSTQKKMIETASDRYRAFLQLP